MYDIIRTDFTRIANTATILTIDTGDIIRDPISPALIMHSERTRLPWQHRSVLP